MNTPLLKYMVTKVLLVIPVHNRPEEVNGLLKSLDLLNLSEIELRLAIVDDGSEPNIELEIDLPKNQRFNIDVYRNTTSLGPGYSRNLASRSYDGEFIWFLDSDTEIIQSDCLQHMISIMRKDPSLAGVGGTLEPFSDGKKIMVWKTLINFFVVPVAYQIDEFEKQYVDHIATSNLLLRNSAFRKTNGFRTDMSRDEDHELCLALEHLGFRFMQDRYMVVWHYLSNVARDSGQFAFFLDQKKYYSSLLQTRIYKMSYYSRGLLIVLPLLDFFMVFYILYKIANRDFSSSRFGRMKNTNPLSKIEIILFILAESVRCYFISYRILLKNFFLFNKGDKK